jgi:hypothetical protein
MALAHQGSDRFAHPVPTSGVASHARGQRVPSHRIEAHGLVQNQGTLLAMVSPLFPPLIKGGIGGFTGKARHAQKFKIESSIDKIRSLYLQQRSSKTDFLGKAPSGRGQG